MTGGVLSSIKMVWLHVLKLPQSSSARHVRVMVYSCGHNPAVVTPVYVTVGVPSQLSVAVAVPVLDGLVLAVHCIVMFAGQLITGPILSVTEMI